MENPRHFDDDHFAATQQVDDRVLKDVVAYVEVRTTNDNRSEAVRRELQVLGATVVKTFTNDVTHVIFKEGSNRTKTKAQKKGVHFVSILWVDSCKQNQEHVSERMYPAIIPKQKGSSLLIAKLKKAKSMQPRDFEEEVSRSAERVSRKKHRIEAFDRLQSAGSTPHSSPRTPLVLVQDTQPRSPDDGFVQTPVRLTIPDTPDSMREKMKQLKIGKEGSYMNENEAAERKYSSKDFVYDKEPLQRKLFMSSGVSFETISPGSNSVFASDNDTKDISVDNETDIEVVCEDENALPVKKINLLHDNIKAKDIRLSEKISHENTKETDIDSVHLVGEDSDSSVTDCILDIAEKINVALNNNSSLDDSVHGNSDEPLGSPKLILDLNLSNNLVNNINCTADIDVKKAKETENLNASELLTCPPVIHNVNDLDTKKEKMEVFHLKNKARRRSRRISLQQIDSIMNDNQEVQNNVTSKTSPLNTSLHEKVLSIGKPSEVSSEYREKKIVDYDVPNHEATETLKSISFEQRSYKSNLITDSKDDNGNDETETHKGCKKSRPKNDKRHTLSDMESKGLKSKKLPKKKLLSLSELNEQHSVLIEPSRSSEAERPELVYKKTSGKRGKKTKENPTDTEGVNNTKIESDLSASSDKAKRIDTENHKWATQESKREGKCNKISEIRVLRNSMDANINNTLLEVKKRELKTKHINRDSSLDGERRELGIYRRAKNDQRNMQMVIRAGSYESSDKVINNSSKKVTDNSFLIQNHRNQQMTEKQRGRKRKSKPKSVSASPKQLKTDVASASNLATTEKPLKEFINVNDTVLTEKGTDMSSKVTLHLNDITTQLNLTANSSEMTSLKDGTLSLSMSAIYNTDSTMQSFLLSQRKSIDEFSVLRKQRNATKSENITMMKENRRTAYITSSDSDNSVSGKPRKKYRPSLVMTSLHSHEQDVVISVVKKLGGFVIAEVVNETTTHVICGEPRRTLNVLHCVARGAWLLKKSWVLKSLEAGSWIGEEEFEYNQFFPVCKVARLEREQSAGKYKSNLFSTVGPIYVSGKSSPPRQHLVQLIKHCGGQVTGILKKASLYIGSDFHPELTCLKTQWILECITQHRLLPADKFSLDRPKREASPVY